MEKVMDTDEKVAELIWHKQVMFAVFTHTELAGMSDDTLEEKLSYYHEQINNEKDAESRKELLAELQDWEKDNGQDTLYWEMKTEYDAWLYHFVHDVVNHQLLYFCYLARQKGTDLSRQNIFPDTDDDRF
jgi:hypothetical protein